jgi:hypothetical protein
MARLCQRGAQFGYDSYSALAARCEATGIAGFSYSRLRSILLTINGIVFCLSWKWRKRSSVKIAERTYEKRAQALHC